MKADIQKTIKDCGFLADEMTIWACRDGVAKASGFIIYNHLGLDALRRVFFPDAKVYALREDDELNCEPATIENDEVMVNFFGYFVTEENLDWIFESKNHREVYSWDYDPWEA